MLINLRNALMSGKRLPYDAEMEYLESTGTQWINTGIYPSSDMSFAFTAALASKVTGTSYSPAFFGGRINTSGGNGIPSWWNSENFWFYGWGNSNDTGGRIIMQFVVNRAYTFHIDRYGITIDGVKKSTLQHHTSIGSTHSIYLFNLNNDGTPDTRTASFRIYNFAIYQNGTLVRDYIPVRKGTVGYLYDRVSGALFGNDGTGDFVLGPDVVPVEYIESHGTEYIDTGFIPGLNFHIDVRGRKAGDYSANAAIFSNEGVNSYVDCYYNAGWGVRCYGNGVVRPIYGGWFDAGIDFDFTSSPTTTFHLNSEEATATTSKTEAQITGSTKSVRLFQGMYGKTNPVDIVFFNADKNGQPALRLSAVRVGTEGAMMDTLTRRIYRNAGTGAFAYGNDLKYPIPAE